MQGAWVQLLDKEEVLHALCCSQKIKILLLFKVISFLLSLKKKVYYFYFLVIVGLHCSTWAFSRFSEWGLLFIAVCRLLIAMASLVAEHRL